MPIKDFDQEAFQKRLKYLRTEVLRLSRTQLAEQLGIAYATYENYESRFRSPKAHFVYSLCAAYGISADWLLGLRDGNPWVR